EPKSTMRILSWRILSYIRVPLVRPTVPQRRRGIDHNGRSVTLFAVLEGRGQARGWRIFDRSRLQRGNSVAPTRSTGRSASFYGCALTLIVSPLALAWHRGRRARPRFAWTNQSCLLPSLHRVRLTFESSHCAATNLSLPAQTPRPGS